MFNLPKHLIRKTFNLLGMDVIRKSNNPKNTFLGIKQLPIHTIIDIGANKGQFAEMITRVFPNANIYCFEPTPAPFEKLSTWAKTQKNVIKVFNVALGDRVDNTKIYVHSEHDPSSSLLKTSNECERIYPFTKKQFTVPVKLTTLDKIFDDLPEAVVPEILIKIDVQGYETNVISGGTETFRKSVACILEAGLVELYENQANFKDILFHLDELGFHYAGNLDQVYDDNGKVIYIDAVFMK